MSNIWGTGGLFESALANKLANQDAKSEAELMTANANLMNANSTQQKVGFDYNVGLRNSAANMANAATNRFGAETDRVKAFDSSPAGAPTLNTIRNLGLRSYNPAPYVGNPMDTANKTLNVERTVGANGVPNITAKMVDIPGTNATATAAANVTTPTPPKKEEPSEFDFGTGEGFKRGGKVAKMGCKKGGKIGDEDEDTGEDTVDVKAREGEYFLNPETVAYLGGGDYDAGVRNLNQIVRQATGKEPGPTRVGKSDKQGFAESGAAVNRSFWERLLNAEVVDPPPSVSVEDVRPGSSIPRGATTAQSGVPEFDSASLRQINRNLGNTVAAEDAAVQKASKIKKGIQAARNVLNGPEATTVEDIVKGAKDVGAKAINTLREVNAPLKVARGVARAPVVSGAIGAVQGLNTDTSDYAKRLWVDNPKSVIGDVGLRTAGVLSDVGADFLTGIALPYNLAKHGLDVDKWWSYRDNFADVAEKKAAAEAKRATEAAAAAAVPTTPAANTPEAAKNADATSTNEQSQGKTAKNSAAPPSIRDMMLKHYAALQAGLGKDQNTDVAYLNRMAMIQKDLADLEKSDGKGASAQETRDKNIDEEIRRRTQVPVYNDKGVITGVRDDPQAAKLLHNVLAEKGVDLSNKNAAERDMEYADADSLIRGMRNFNDRVIDQRGDDAITSEYVQPYSVEKGISLMDALLADNNAITLGDWWDSVGKDSKDIRSHKVRDRNGQTVAASQVFRKPDGSLDQDAFDLYVNAQNRRGK